MDQNDCDALQDALIKIAVLETQLDGMKESVRLQAYEYERRLTELNHAHARATEDKNKFLTNELFYAYKDEVNGWRGEMDRWRAKMMGVAIGAGLGGGAVGGGLVGFILKMFQ